MGTNTKVLMDIFNRLLCHYGPQHWWPGETQFEVIVGAILTQSAAWTNVEKAITNLKEAGVLTPGKMGELSPDELAVLIRPSGYYNAKAVKLKSFLSWLKQYYADDLSRLLTQETRLLRDQLLSVHGIGEETADSIMLYAIGKPVFVIDAYTKRITGRIGILPGTATYGTFQKFFMNNLPSDAGLFNEFHALFVALGKHNCRKQPLCSKCCLGDVCQLNLSRVPTVSVE